MIADDQTNRQIGAGLRLAERTVNNYVSTILSRIEVARRADAGTYLARRTTTPGA
jgi:DNA-binding NarL/FixJ family response regulator